MTRRSFDDPKHCLERAEEARAQAEVTLDPEAKRQMLDIARGYERLAERARHKRKLMTGGVR